MLRVLCCLFMFTYTLSNCSAVKKSEGIEPIKMSYSSYESTLPDGNKNGPPIIIMHGLLGSRYNWNSMAKAILNRLKRKIIAVDARNHGDSPHTYAFSYHHLCADIIEIMKDLELKNATLMGHSMGGRAMMLVALQYPHLVDRLVIVDISPVGESPGMSHIPKLFDAMYSVQLEANTSMSRARKEAEQQLRQKIIDSGLIQFLLTNLVEAEDGSYKWRVNIDSLSRNFESKIMKFPNATGIYSRPTLFIGGGKSDYIRKDDHDAIRKCFPSAEFEYIPDAGHWVHAEKPKEFVDVLTKFIEKTDKMQ